MIRVNLHFLNLLSSFNKNNSKKTNLKTYPPKKIILKVDFELKLSNYTSLQRFI